MPSETKKAIKTITYLTFPSLIIYQLDKLEDFINIYFLSRYGTIYTAAYGVAMLWVTILGLSILYGLASGLDTLCSQAYGKGNYKTCGIYYNRARILITITSIPLIVASIFANKILPAIGIEKETSELAHEMILYWIPNLIFLSHYEISENFLQAQKVFYPQLFASGGASVLHPLWCWILSHYFGYYGVICSKIITNGIAFLAITIYIYCSRKYKQTLAPFNAKVFQNWGRFIKISVAGCLMICVEWWASELLSLIAAYISTAELAANVSINALSSSIYMLNVAIGATTTALVGNKIGEGDVKSAKFYAVLCSCCNIILLMVVCIAILIFRTQISHFLSEDPEVQAFIIKCIIVLMMGEVFDSSQGLLGRIIVSLGKQKVGFILNVVVFYVIVLPCAYLFSITAGIGIYGLYLGYMIGVAIIMFVMLWYLTRLDWNAVSKQCRDELTKEESATGSVEY